MPLLESLTVILTSWNEFGNAPLSQANMRLDFDNIIIIILIIISELAIDVGRQ
jgi:hypothetical protein